MRQRALNILIALDQFLFCLIMLGNSYPDETASACAWRLEQAERIQGKIFRPIIDGLFWFDHDHCRRSWEDEYNRAQSPSALDKIV